MKARTKSALLLVATLVVGGLIGAVTTGTIVNNRLDQLQELRRPGGFSGKLEQVIGPTDDAQRAQINAVLERSQARFAEVRRECGGFFAAHRDSMRADLAPLLTAEQLTRLDGWLKRDHDPGRRGHGGPDGRRERRQHGNRSR